MRLRIAAVALGLAGAWAMAASAEYDRAAFSDAATAIAIALRDGDYDRLEAMHDEFSRPEARSIDGNWMIRAFQFAFEGHYWAQPSPAIEAEFANWKSKRPASRLRPIAEAFAWQERARESVGGRCRAVQSSNALKAYTSLLNRSADALRENESAGKDSALWHTAAILVAGGQSRPPGEVDGLLQQALARFPGYEPLYLARMTFLLPSWGGDWDSVDRFVHRAVEDTAALEGSALYARLYVDLSRICPKIYEEAPVSWTEMRVAFEDLVQRHGDTANLNLFATFACRARDIETTTRLLGELGPKARIFEWFPSVTTKNCYEMVRPARVPEQAS